MIDSNWINCNEIVQDELSSWWIYYEIFWILLLLFIFLGDFMSRNIKRFLMAPGVNFLINYGLQLYETFDGQLLIFP